MFINKRIISDKKYYYLEETINLYGDRRKISVYLSDPKSKEALDKAFIDLRNKIGIEASKIVLQKRKPEVLSTMEIIELEKLRYDYLLFKRYFKEGFKSFDKDEYVRFAQGSASVEGNSLSLLETALVMDKGIAIEGKQVYEIQEIINLKNVKQKIFSKKQKLTEKLIKNIHKEVLYTFEEKHPGKYRTEPVYLTGSSYLPPNASRVQELMNEFMDYYSNNKDQVYPVELSSYLHIFFESVHPFSDGNGRTGRELLNLILMDNGFPRVIINLNNRNRYINLLERLQNSKDYNKFSIFIYDLLMERKKEISQIVDENKEYLLNKLRKKVKAKPIRYD